jgi:hypothetical protein
LGSGFLSTLLIYPLTLTDFRWRGRKVRLVNIVNNTLPLIIPQQRCNAIPAGRLAPFRCGL